jgi:tartronate-semialdehyde synthase
MGGGVLRRLPEFIAADISHCRDYDLHGYWRDPAPPLHYRHPGGFAFGNRTLRSDLVLGIGCRLAIATPEAGGLHKGRRFIHIDIDPNVIGRIVPTELGIVSGRFGSGSLLDAARSCTPALLPTEQSARSRRYGPGWHAKLISTTVQSSLSGYIIGQRIFGADTIFTTGCGLTQIWSGQFQSIERPQTYLALRRCRDIILRSPRCNWRKIARPSLVVP